MKPLTPEQHAQLERLKQMRPEDIDLSDIPETTDWEGASRGQRPPSRKAPVTLHLDADVLEWFKSQTAAENADINRILRQYMLEHQKAQ